MWGGFVFLFQSPAGEQECCFSSGFTHENKEQHLRSRSNKDLKQALLDVYHKSCARAMDCIWYVGTKAPQIISLPTVSPIIHVICPSLVTLPGATLKIFFSVYDALISQ